MRLKPADEHNQQVLTSLILSCCRWKHPPSLSLSQEGGALSFTCLTLNAALRGCEQAAWCQLTLKSPLSMMSMILYCWLMSFSSTRFFRAFSWSFRLVSNRRLSGAKRSGGHTLSLHMGIDHTHSLTHTHSAAEGYRSPGWSHVLLCVTPGLPWWKQRRRRVPPTPCRHSAWSAGGSKEALYKNTGDKWFLYCALHSWLHWHDGRSFQGKMN